MSGILHWAFDTWFFPDHPIFDRMVLMVREHHLVPLAMFRYPFYHDAGTLSWIMLLVAGPFLIPTLCAPGPPSLFALAAVGATVVISVCVVFMLEFHKCGHRQPARGILGLLQRCHLVLDPRHHAQHHRAPYTEKYCIVTGWANPVLDGIGFYRGLERLISLWTGAVPRQSDREFMARYARAQPSSGPRRGAKGEAMTEAAGPREQHRFFDVDRSRSPVPYSSSEPQPPPMSSTRSPAFTPQVSIAYWIFVVR